MRRILLGLSFLALAGSVPAQLITVNLVLYGLYDDNGATLLPGDNMLQFVNLGANGVFDPVAAGAWVGGDDRLVVASYLNNTNPSLPAEFPSAAAFDTWPGPNGDPGTAEPVLPFQSLEDGLYGVRWWGGYRPADYYSGHLPIAGDHYGQFSRTTDPRHGGDVWVINGPGVYGFDALAVESFGGADEEFRGFASFLVSGDLPPVPEPSTFALCGVFTLLAAVYVKRRARR